MSKNYPIECLVVIGDGTLAKLFRNKAGDGALDLVIEDTIEHDQFDGDGPAGKRPVESSSKETGEATFAKQLALHLNSMAEAGRFSALVLVADPQTLGQIRPSLDKKVREALLSEHPKTLTNAAMDEIVRSLS